jgi:hypothetical protein
MSFQTVFCINILFWTILDTPLYYLKKSTAFLQGINNELYYQRAIQTVAAQAVARNSKASPTNVEKSVDTPE